MSRSKSFAFISVVYLVALAVSVPVLRWFSGATYWDVLAADLAATLIVFIASIVVNNSSMYDAYWSIAPPAIAAYLLAPPSSHRQWLTLLLVVLWAIRLTANWARSFEGLKHEDWRYVDIRAKTGRAYWIASLFALHLFPTLIVFAGLLPIWAVRDNAFRFSGAPLGMTDMIATAIGFGAVFLEWTADEQLRSFRNDPRNAGKPIESGLWRHSRHPNYLGEIGFWWGLGLFGFASFREPSPQAALLSLSGAIAIHLMFVLATIPMAEKRALKRRPDYAARMEKTRMLLPFPRRAA